MSGTARGYLSCTCHFSLCRLVRLVSHCSELLHLANTEVVVLVRSTLQDHF